jgi:Pyridoxamine 5'-phosphate oxidase
MELNDEIRRLLDGRHFAVLATINPDGSPQTSAMWVGRAGDEVLFSTVAIPTPTRRARSG